MAAAVDIDASRLVEPSAHTRGYPHEEWASLRQVAPVEQFHLDGWRSFNFEKSARNMRAESG